MITRNSPLRAAAWKILLLSACALGLAAGRGAAAPAGLEQSDLFVAGTDGYHTYRIPVLLATPAGTVLAFCEGRRRSASDTGQIDLLLRRSTDGGRTWSEPQVVWSDGNNVCGNPAPVADQASGQVWLLMTWNLGSDHEREIMAGTSKDTRRVFVTRSADNGRSWSPPREITASVKRPHWRWYATGPANGIQLTRGAHAGRLVVPANHSDHSDTNHHPYRAHVIYSDDRGQTWKLGGIEEEKTNESTLVELADGTLLHNMRSYHNKNRRALATSRDGGLTWSPVKLDPVLLEPVCQASLLRATWPGPGQRGLILFSNPASLKRMNLTLRFSYDEAKTWPESVTLHAGPAAYSGLACLPDGTILCAYECGEASPYEKIRLARLPRGQS